MFVMVFVMTTTKSVSGKERQLANYRKAVERTLGLPVSAERAAMAKAYENYATAQLLHTKAHNAWRRAERKASETEADLSHSLKKRLAARSSAKGALTKAATAATYLNDAKAQYRSAKAVAIKAAAA